jgi:hypothetical protein
LVLPVVSHSSNDSGGSVCSNNPANCSTSASCPAGNNARPFGSPPSMTPWMISLTATKAAMPDRPSRSIRSAARRKL